MMFHDSMANAQEKMTQVCHLLELHALPPTPLNYHVLYQHVSEGESALSEALQAAVTEGRTIDSVLMEELYIQHLTPDHQKQTAMVERMSELIGNLERNSKSNQKHIDHYHLEIDRCARALDEHDVDKSRHQLRKLAEHTLVLKGQMQKFKQLLEQIKQQYLSTKSQLKRLKDKHHLDPLTGLYHRHYLDKKFQYWAKKQHQISLIRIDVENYQQFCHDYGDSIGNLMLEKVATKIDKYVKESGFCGRTQNEQFTIMMADVEAQTVDLIAEKVQAGISKLRFVSSRSGKQLPGVAFQCQTIHRQQEPNFSALVSSTH